MEPDTCYGCLTDSGERDDVPGRRCHRLKVRQHQCGVGDIPESSMCHLEEIGGQEDSWRGLLCSYQEVCSGGVGRDFVCHTWALSHYLRQQRGFTGYYTETSPLLCRGPNRQLGLWKQEQVDAKAGKTTGSRRNCSMERQQRGRGKSPTAQHR